MIAAKQWIVNPCNPGAIPAVANPIAVVMNDPN
jgi:hypothetical protein